jgi:hypothetical protein
MSVTSRMAAAHPIPGVTGGVVDANKQREFAAWVEAKEVRNTPFADWMERRKEPYSQVDIEIGQSYAPFIATTLGAQAGASDEQLTVASTALLRAGDQIEIKQFYSGSTTEYNHSLTETATILTVDSATLVTVERHEGEVSDGSYTVHASGSVVTVKGSAISYNDPFRDGITFRGDSITQHPQRFENGEITYDLAADVATFEAEGGHWERDLMQAKNDLPFKRNWAFINGRKRTGSYLVTPKIPYRLGGAIWFAEQVADNDVQIDGLLNFFDFTDVWEDMASNHSDGPGDTAWMAPRMRTIWSEMFLPYKGMFDAGSTILKMASGLETPFGELKDSGIKTDNQWPPHQILICSRKDFKWGHFETEEQSMDWIYVNRGKEELGAFQKSWNMGGDFSMQCDNVTHLRLLDDIETRKELYPARSNFL